MRNLVEIGERGMHENKEQVRMFLSNGTHFYPMWKVRSGLGIEGLCNELAHAYEGTSSIYALLIWMFSAGSARSRETFWEN